MSDIVERLRDTGDHARFEPHLHHEAADEIERLRAEIERLKDVLQNLLDHQNGPPLGGRFGESWALAVDQAIAALDKAEEKRGCMETAADEIERLREIISIAMESIDADDVIGAYEKLSKAKGLQG